MLRGSKNKEADLYILHSYEGQNLLNSRNKYLRALTGINKHNLCLDGAHAQLGRQKLIKLSAPCAKYRGRWNRRKRGQSKEQQEVGRKKLL